MLYSSQTTLVYDLSLSITTEEQLKEVRTQRIYHLIWIDIKLIFLQMQVLNTTVQKEAFEKALHLVSENIEFLKGSYREDIEEWFREYIVEDMINSNTV